MHPNDEPKMCCSLMSLHLFNIYINMKAGECIYLNPRVVRLWVPPAPHCVTPVNRAWSRQAPQTGPLYRSLSVKYSVYMHDVTYREGCVYIAGAGRSALRGRGLAADQSKRSVAPIAVSTATTASQEWVRRFHDTHTHTHTHTLTHSLIPVPS